MTFQLQCQAEPEKAPEKAPVGEGRGAGGGLGLKGLLSRSRVKLSSLRGILGRGNKLPGARALQGIEGHL